MSGVTPTRRDYWQYDIVPGGEHKELNTINLGPTHPATHGIFQNVLTMDGEFIQSAEQTIGYIHRAFEKIGERRPFYQITPLLDRMNYCSAPINNMGWHTAVEKLLKLEVPERVDHLRVIVMELARITDHLICNTVIGVDTGALTGFTYLFQDREFVYEIYEEICGSRLTTNMGRIGGFERDFSETAWKKIRHFVDYYPKKLKEFENLLCRNRIFMDRTINCSPFPADRALAYGFTGPNLRACGVDYDVRVMDPYCRYNEYDFEIPIGQNGDVYDRFMVRQQEQWQSLSIIRQAIEKLDRMSDKTSFVANQRAFVLPPKEQVYNSMEALIWHFKIVMGETEIPVGEVYHCVEGANGELGFYLVSDGGRTPQRLHFRRPCFVYYQAFPEMVKGIMLSDAILALSSMNVIAGSSTRNAMSGRSRTINATQEAPPFAFSEKGLAECRTLISHYPEGKHKSALLPILHIAQTENGGWLSVNAMDVVAALLKIQPIEVYEVATFYSMYHLEPVGKCVLEVCQTTPCWLRGADDLVAHLEKELGIKNGGTTPDGMFTLKTVECLGSCGTAPMLQCGAKYYEGLTPEKADHLIADLRAKNVRQNYTDR